MRTKPIAFISFRVCDDVLFRMIAGNKIKANRSNITWPMVMVWLGTRGGSNVTVSKTNKMVCVRLRPMRYHFPCPMSIIKIELNYVIAAILYLLQIPILPTTHSHRPPWKQVVTERHRNCFSVVIHFIALWFVGEANEEFLPENMETEKQKFNFTNLHFWIVVAVAVPPFSLILIHLNNLTQHFCKHANARNSFSLKKNFPFHSLT